ncbi:MAG: hypothetical protein RIR70_590 [Pseudomonadota bacterium]|jgi:hypothetical protein
MKTIFAIAILVSLTACDDGVPEVEDPQNIVINGQKMSSVAFLEKYCIGKTNNETCAKVSYYARKNATRGPMPKGW